MSVTAIPSAEGSVKGMSGNREGVERRRRKRAKISAQVHVRAVNSPEPFAEICKSVDVSRDGLLFTTSRAGYWKGQQLDVTFPFSNAATALNQAQRAEVVRTSDLGSQTAVAVQFVCATTDSASATKGKEAFGANSNGANNAQTKHQSVVLAVESDPRTAEMMRTVLQNDGYTVVVVSSAQAALEVLRTTVPAVFLAEVESEEMSGHDLCLIVKRNDRLQHVPVILLTKAAQPADYAASHQLGAVVCMAKPFKPERLLHVVRLVAPPPAMKNVYGSRVSSGSIERAF